METQSNLPPLIKPKKNWGQAAQESVTVKLLIIGILVVILIIPTSWIKDLINERQDRAEDVEREVAGKWSGRQTLAGPILEIPYTTYIKNPDGTVREETGKAFFLPDQLTVNGVVDPQVLHRGIFDAVVYSSDLDVQASFSYPDFSSLGIREENVLWKNATMIFSVSDIGGLSTIPVFKVGDRDLTTSPSGNLDVVIKQYQYSELPSKGLVAKPNWQSAEDFNGDTSLKLTLRGSRQLNFMPTGKATSVHLQGPWSDPSFDGEFLPEQREVTEAGFSAQWNILHFNRPFAQQWTGTGEQLTGSWFGLKLLLPVDQYQQSMRTSKYAQLIIILTFVSLFLVEITRKIRIHPFQYILIGAALIIYYTLLLSISEQAGFTIAYWIATAATITLVTLYASSFLKNAGLVLLLCTLMSVFYSFIFVIILQQDLSLLIGSIGLFFVVAALMYFSRNVTWYKPADHA